MSAGDRLVRFLAFSVDATAFTQFELRGTGQAEAYLDTTVLVVGEDVVDRVLDAHGAAVALADGDRAELHRLLRRDVLSDPELGPVARNVAKMWYLGIWYELPSSWTNAFGVREHNTTFMVSGMAYIEALLWPAIGANPPGAKPPGFGSWAAPPRVPGVP